MKGPGPAPAAPRRRPRPAPPQYRSGMRHLLRRILSDWQLVTGGALLLFLVIVALGATAALGNGITSLNEN
ncbi:MAG: hypothetical protein L3K09_01485, partial [Thermoplasmata archaeon]|nr:hypothetical protein [Thermoplasmata archaeon]